MPPYWTTLRRRNVFWRILAFLAILGLVWLPIAIPLYALDQRLGSGSGSLIATALLYLEFVCLLYFWARVIHRQPYPFQVYGLRVPGAILREGILTLLIGLGGVIGLFGLEILLGWAVLQEVSAHLVRIVLEGLLIGLLVAVAEELLFRGWLLFELERDLSLSFALWINSLLFTLAHFVKPWSAILRTWPQFFGLLVLGMALVWARRTPQPCLGLGPSRQPPMTSLWLPIGFHAGLIWGYYIINVGNLVQPTQQVPAWLTGVDQNPLAGVAGVVLLSCLAWGFRYAAYRPGTHTPFLR